MAGPALIPPGRGWLPWLLAQLCASAGLWWALSVVPVLPTNDGPQHIMMGHIENHYDDPGTLYRHYLAPAPQYAGRGFAALFVPLEPLLGWRGAFRVTVFVVLLAWAWGLALLVVVVEPRRRWLSLLGFFSAFQWTVYMGFLAFVAGSALGLWVLALAVATRRWSGPRLALLALALLLQGVLHVFAALLTAFAVVALGVARSGADDGVDRSDHGAARQRGRALGRLALALLPLGALFLLSLREQPAAARMAHAGETVLLPLGDKLRYLHRCFLPGGEARGLTVVALALLGIGRGLRSPGASQPAARALALSSLALLLAAVLGPERLPGWQFVWQRFLPLGLLLPLPLLEVERLATTRARRGALAAALALATAGSLLEAASIHRRLYRRSADVFGGLSLPLSRSGLRLPVVRDPWFSLPPARSPVPGMVPLHAVAALFVAEQGGMIPYMFIDQPAVHQFVGKDPAWEHDFPPRPPPDKLQQLAHLPLGDPRRLRALDELARDGAGYEDVILVSAPADADAFRRRGYATDHQQGELYLGHYRGCEVTLELPQATGLRSVEYGWWPLLDARRTLPPPAGGEPGRLRLPLPGAPCGASWIRVIADGVRCAEADQDGLLRAQAEPDRPASVSCSLR